MSNSLTPEPGTERITRSSVRNPRRRPRQSDADSVKSAPRRKRNKISEDTFVPPRLDEEEVNGTIELASPNGSIQPVSPRRGRGRPRKNSNSTMAMEVAIPVREKKSSVKRPTRGDGATVLAQYPRYSVKLLPSTPRELRREGVEWRGALGAGHHALAITRKSAYIWDYTAHTTVSSPRIFDVPFAVRETDPPPFGALVTTGTGTDFGLLIISATTGETFFYESIERAASLGLFQDRKAGVAGSAGAFYSGESVVDLISAEHAGFIVTLSSGRIAQLTLRDTQGRARISSQFLKATEQTTGGFFGSIKGLLGSSGWTKDVAAVRTRPLGIRGQMQVISLTARGEVQLWDLDWSGQHTYRGTIDFREMIIRELKGLESPELEGRAENFTAVDFAILQKTSSGSELTTLAAELPVDLAILLRNGSPDKHKYALAEVSLEGADVNISRVMELDTYNSPLNHAARSKPRLVLPKTRHTAFVAFPDAVVLTSMEESQLNSPEAQLHASYVGTAPFEDTVYLRQDNRCTVLGACEEDSKSDQASAIVFVKGAGLVRITAVDPNTIPRLPRTPVKSKIEQAVFHGALQEGNIIDFSHTDTTSSPQEVEGAALKISNEILTSTSPFISTTPTSIEVHLDVKARALEALVRHVRQSYPALGPSAMWQLLWDAERVAAAQQMWRTFQDHVASSSQEKRTATLLDELCFHIIQQLDPQPEAAKDSDDTVHEFFIHNLHHIERIFPKIAEFLQMLQTDTDNSPEKKLVLLLQANELWNRTLDTVFAFRTEHAAAYGILPEVVDDGILTDIAEYVDIPEFWTSTKTMLKSARSMGPVSRHLVEEEYDKVENGSEEVVMQIGEENPRLIENLCRICKERINWMSSRQDERSQERAEELRLYYHKTRHEELRSLSAIAQTEAGMKLAEKYKDMQTLTEIIVAEIQYALEVGSKSQDKDDKRLERYIADLTARTTKYFDRFGDDWANAYFDFGFSGNHAGIMLQLAQENWPDALTKYLRGDKSRFKLCWIDDIYSTRDFEHAQQCLDEVALDQETQLWAKKVELSMAKLAHLAYRESKESNGEVLSEQDQITSAADRNLEIVRTQEQLYQHFYPEIRSCIDFQAKIEVSMQKFGYKNQDLSALRKVLEADVERLLLHIALSVDELIDMLTLMDSYIADAGVDHNLQGQEFYLALKALNAAAPSLPQERVDLLLQLIWKRCYVYDDWVEINSAQKQSEDEIENTLRTTVPWRTFYYALEHGLLGPDSNIRRLSPSECLGAGCMPEELEYRWPEPDILHPILNDNKIQDEQLQGFVQDRRLDEWIEMCFRSAKREVVEQAEEKAQRLQHERTYEKLFDLEASKGHEMNGHAKGPNGIEDEDSDGSDLYQDGAEGGDGEGDESVLYQQGNEDEDVEME